MCLLLGYAYTLEQHPDSFDIDTVASAVFDVILLSLRKPGKCVDIYWPLDSLNQEGSYTCPDRY